MIELGRIVCVGAVALSVSCACPATTTTATTPPPPPADDTSAPPPSTDQPVTAEEIVGHWTGDWGDLYLQAEADGTVRGVYPHDTGTVTGTMEGGKFRGWWCEAPSRQPTADAGVVEFTFVRRDDGKMDLDGRWKYGADESAAWKENWDLSWVEQEIDPNLVARFADASQFCRQP